MSKVGFKSFITRCVVSERAGNTLHFTLRLTGGRGRGWKFYLKWTFVFLSAWNFLNYRLEIYEVYSKVSTRRSDDLFVVACRLLEFIVASIYCWKAEQAEKNWEEAFDKDLESGYITGGLRCVMEYFERIFYFRQFIQYENINKLIIFQFIWLPAAHMARTVYLKINWKFYFRVAIQDDFRTIFAQK